MGFTYTLLLFGNFKFKGEDCSVSTSSSVCTIAPLGTLSSHRTFSLYVHSPANISRCLSLFSSFLFWSSQSTFQEARLRDPKHYNSNILDVTRPQTNSDSVCLSPVCVQVKCSLTLSTCLSNELALQQNVRQDRKFQAQRDVQCLSACARCIDAWSCGQSSV